MHRRRIHICLLIMGWMALRAAAQPATYDIPGYSVMHFTDENGLPQNSIKTLAMDGNGYVWMATEAGIVRYDGRLFRLFSKKEMGTDNTRIGVMGRDPYTGHLYAKTEGDEAAQIRINAREQIFYPLNPYLSDKSLSALFGRPVTSQVHHWPSSFPQFTDKEALIYIAPDTFYLASPGHVSFCTYRNVIWETPIEKKSGYFFYWQGKKLFMYNDQGVFLEITPQGVKPALRIRDYKKLVWNLAEKQSYILSKSGELSLLELDSTEKLVLTPFMSGIPSGFDIENVLHIKKQVIFMGSLRQGLLVYKKQYFKTLGADLPGHRSIHYGLYPWGDEMITAKKTRIGLDGKVVPLIDDAYLSFNTSLTRLGKDTLLFAQANTVLAYDFGTAREFRSIPVGNKVTCLYTDARRQVWVATIDSGLYKMDHTLVPAKQVALPRTGYVNNIVEVAPGHLLLGTTSGLFSYYTDTRRLVEHTEARHLNIRHILVSKAGYMYFCTYGDGIFMLGKHGLIALPTDRGKYLKMAHCIVQDTKRRFWISTNKGLFYVPETECIHYAQGDIRQISYHYFGKENGFHTNEFNGGCQPCGISLQSGHIAFPSMNGVVVFHPDSVYIHNPARKLQVERISVDDVFLDQIPDTVSVKRNFKQLEVYLSTPFYGTLYNLMLEYSMDSARADSWAPVHSDRRVSFTSLPSGYSRLTFRKKKMAALGAYTYCTLVLYKPRAFWEFPLFWAVCVLTLAAGVALAIRLRTRTLKERNRKLAVAVDAARHELLVTIDSLTDTTQKLEQKTRFQQWLTSSIIHDLRGPLRFIHFHGGDIRKEETDTTPEQNKFLKSVYFSAQKIYAYSENLVQLLRIEQTSDFPPEKTDFMALVEEKVDQFREQAKWNDIHIIPDPDSDPFIYVNRAALSIVIQNLLDNSIKNGKNGNIYLSLQNGESHSVIVIRDEGPGLPPELIHKFNLQDIDQMSKERSSGIGLWLIKSMMEQTGGKITFENAPEKGLIVTLTWAL